MYAYFIYMYNPGSRGKLAVRVTSPDFEAMKHVSEDISRFSCS